MLNQFHPKELGASFATGKASYPPSNCTLSLSPFPYIHKKDIFITKHGGHISSQNSVLFVPIVAYIKIKIKADSFNLSAFLIYSDYFFVNLPFKFYLTSFSVIPAAYIVPRPIIAKPTITKKHQKLMAIRNLILTI